MSLLELLNHRLDDGHTVLLVPGTVGRVVGVSSGTVPVALEWFRVERDFDAPFFGTSDEEETSHGHVVTRLDTDARTDLEFPLSAMMIFNCKKTERILSVKGSAYGMTSALIPEILMPEYKQAR